MADFNVDDIKKLRPSERLKKLKEFEAEVKEELEEADKLILQLLKRL